MQLRPSLPEVQYRLWHRSHGLIDTASIVDDPDGLLRLAFTELTFHPEGGLLIHANGRPWNDPKYFDSFENLASWFDGVRQLASGEQQRVDIWAWEESHCYAAAQPGGSILIEDTGHLPPVLFERGSLFAEFAAAARRVLDLDASLRARVDQLRLPAYRGVPRAALAWASEIPKHFLRERQGRPTGVFVPVTGASLGQRWKRVESCLLPQRNRWQIQRCLEELTSS